MLPKYLIRAILILYLKTYVSCHGNSSLVYVIDDTMSMGPVIEQVKTMSAQIMHHVLSSNSSIIENMVLVTFNDPKVKRRIVTRNQTEFENEFQKIQVNNYFNSDCPEYSLSGMIKGLENSLPNSLMYVFTDAAAKDYAKGKGPITIDLCMKKQTQINILLTLKRCGYKLLNLKDENVQVYYDIATKCNGQVYVMKEREISEFMQAVNVTINDQKSIVTNTIVQPNVFDTPVTFHLDDKIEYAIISTTGTGVKLEVVRDQHDESSSGILENRGAEAAGDRLMWTENIKIFKLYNSISGDYIAFVNGADNVSVVVYAKTDFTFEHGFSEVIPVSFADVSTRPTAGKYQHLSILANSDHGVGIEDVNILSLEYKILMTMPLKLTDGDFYTTDKFVAPNSSFIIQVKGINNQTGTPIYRKSRTVIEPIPVAIPKQTFIVGSKFEETTKVKYERPVKLLCDIKSDLAFERAWFSDKAEALALKGIDVEGNKGEEFVINSMAIDLEGSYGCRVWLVSDPSVFIEQNTTLKIDDLSAPAITVSKGYANNTNNFIILTCLPTGHPNPTVTWYYAKDIEGPFMDLGIKGLELIIENTKRNRERKPVYKCVAENAVGKQEETFELEERYIALVNDSILSIPCKIEGNPEPVAVWKDRNNKMIATGPKYTVIKRFNFLILLIKNPSFNDTGIFTCETSNYLGMKSKRFEAYVTDNFQNNIELYGETHFISILENDSKDLKCNAAPSNSRYVRWYKNGIYIDDVFGRYFPITHAVASDAGIYTCRSNQIYDPVSESYVVDIQTKPSQ